MSTEFFNWHLEDRINFLLLFFPKISRNVLLAKLESKQVDEYRRKIFLDELFEELQQLNQETDDDGNDTISKSEDDEFMKTEEYGSLLHMFPDTEKSILVHCLKRNAGNLELAIEDVITMASEKIDIISMKQHEPPLLENKDDDAVDYLQSVFPQIKRKVLQGYYLKEQRNLEISVQAIIEDIENNKLNLNKKDPKLELQNLYKMFPLMKRENLERIYARNNNDLDGSVTEIFSHFETIETLEEMFPSLDLSYIEQVYEHFQDLESSSDWLLNHVEDKLLPFPASSNSTTEKSYASILNNGINPTSFASPSSLKKIKETSALNTQEIQSKPLSSKEFERYREEAFSAFDSGHENFVKAIEVYNAGGMTGRLAAAHYAQQLSNPDYPRILTKIDLHGLYVKEALAKLEEALALWYQKYKDIKCKPPLTIITGRGKNSADRSARIRTAVLKRIQQGWDFVIFDVGSVQVLDSKDD